MSECRIIEALSTGNRPRQRLWTSTVRENFQIGTQLVLYLTQASSCFSSDPGVMALLSTRAKGVAVGIWRKIDFFSNGHELCLLPQQIDDLADPNSAEHPTREAMKHSRFSRHDQI